MKNIWIGILIALVLALLVGYRQQNIINQRQTAIIKAQTEQIRVLNELVQANWRDIEAISSHFMVWAELDQYRPGVK